MAQQPRRYRRKPFAVFEHGTRIYAPCPSEDCFRVAATDATGKRFSYKFANEDDARDKARELEAFLASCTPIYGGRTGDRTVGVLASSYIEHLEGRSIRYRERQEAGAPRGTSFGRRAQLQARPSNSWAFESTANRTHFSSWFDLAEAASATPATQVVRPATASTGGWILTS